MRTFVFFETDKGRGRGGGGGAGGGVGWRRSGQEVVLFVLFCF